MFPSTVCSHLRIDEAPDRTRQKCRVRSGRNVLEANYTHCLTGEAMKYLCLVYGEEAVLDAMSQEDSDDLTRISIEYDQELARRGHLIAAQALMPVRTAKTVRVRKEKVRTTDGPFAETKEQLLGFVYIEAADEAEAVSIASEIPLAKVGSIEVRAIMPLG